MSDRLKHLEELGFIGCLNDSVVDSTNYKEFLYGQKMQWISVKDQSPKINRIMVWTGHNVQIVHRDYDEWCLTGTEKEDGWETPADSLNHFTHWMPLPEPPKDD